MTDEQQNTAEILNLLHEAEMSSLLARLPELNLSVSWSSAEQFEVVKRLVADAREHRQWLIDAIEAAGSGVWPVTLDPRTANLHYLSLESIMPRLILDLRRLGQAYSDAMKQKPLTSEGAELIARIGPRYQTYLQQLQKMNHSTLPATV